MRGYWGIVGSVAPEATQVYGNMDLGDRIRDSESRLGLALAIRFGLCMYEVLERRSLESNPRAPRFWLVRVRVRIRIKLGENNPNISLRLGLYDTGVGFKCRARVKVWIGASLRFRHI